MRILLVISGLGLGGAEKQVILLSNELCRRGHAVCIYALTNEIARADELAKGSAELLVDPKSTRLDLRVLWRLRRHIHAWKPDIVHGFLFDGNIYARLAAAGSGVSVLDSERNDSYALSGLQALGYRLTGGLSRGVVANSHAGSEFAANNYLRPGQDSHVLWNGIDLHELDRRLSPVPATASEIVAGAGLKRVAVVGTIKPQKDQVLAMRVARKLVDADDRWRMIVVGGELSRKATDYKHQVVKARDDLGLQDVVSFVGSRRDVPEIMASSDAVLVTSHHEGFPNVVLEAMACRTPVVSTDYSDVRKILPMDWQVVASRDEDELVQALLRCDREREAVVIAQRRWVETHATASICAERLLSIYASYTPMATTAAEQVG